MDISKSFAFRLVVLAVGIGALSAATVLLFRHLPVAGFLLAFCGLSAIALFETDLDYAAKYSLRTFFSSLKGRSRISALGLFCDVSSYLCLAAALISWLALR